MNDIVLHPQCEIDLTDAARAYERSLLGTGRAFINEARRMLWSVDEVPDSDVARRNGIYRVMMIRFPYCIAYRRRQGRIEALSILPTNASPERLLSRIAARA